MLYVEKSIIARTQATYMTTEEMIESIREYFKTQPVLKA